MAEGKAIPPHPALTARDVPTTIYAPGQPTENAKLSDRSSARYMEAFGGPQAIDWVGNCISLYVDTISTAEWSIEDTAGRKLIQPGTISDDPDAKEAPQDLYDLLTYPNPYMLYDELIGLLVQDLLLTGNGYWFKWRNSAEGKPLALYRMAPPYVKIIPSKFGAKGYEYQPPGARDPLEIAFQDVMHFKLPNPRDSYYGMGVIQSGGRALDLELSLTDDQAQYFENKADPSLIVETQRRVPRDVFNKLRAQLRARMAGKAGELLVLEAGLKANSISPNARDRMYSELSQVSRNRVLSMFRASPMLFGMLDEVGGGNKVQDAQRQFDTKTMRPFMDKLQRRITAWLVRAWDDTKFVIDYSYVMPPEEIIEQTSKLAAIPGIKIREVRRNLRSIGIEESTGDPEIDDIILNATMDNMDATGQGGSPDRPLEGEPGRPPKTATTNFIRPGVPPNGKALTVDEILERLKALPEGKAATERTSIGNRLSAEERPADNFLDERDAEIDATTAFMESHLNEALHTLERELFDHVEGKAFNGGKGLVGRIRKSAAWRVFENKIDDILKEGARRAAVASAVHHAQQGNEAGIDPEKIADRVINRKEGSKGIAKNLKDAVAIKVARVLEKQGSQEDVRAAVRESMNFFRTSKALTIGMTEAVESYNEATLIIAEDLGHEEVFVIDGRDDDEPCKSADGQTWTIEHARKNRTEHPRCRRAFLLQ